MARRIASGRINEEHVCLDAFVQHLRQIDSRQEITYSAEPDDPPDFWVTIAGVTYAVEVTVIVIDYDYDALRHGILKDICSECEKGNAMRGTYALVITRRPHIPSRRRSYRGKLVSTAAATIQDMSDAPCGIESCLLEEANGCFKIVKLSDQGNVVHWCISGEAKWEGEVQEELTQLFEDTVDKKRVRFERKGILRTCSNIVLLLYDAYGYATPEHARQAFSNVQGYEWAHSVFLAVPSSGIANTLYPDTPGRTGIFLYSRNVNWL